MANPFRQKRIPLRWTSNLSDPEEKRQFEQSILGSRIVLERLLQILLENEEMAQANECSIKDFEDAAWAYKQAFRNGVRSTSKSLQELLSFIDTR